MGIQSLQLGSAISRLREPVIHLDDFFFLSEMIFSAILRRISPLPFNNSQGGPLVPSRFVERPIKEK
jgi:hypothetical protein